MAAASVRAEDIAAVWTDIVAPPSIGGSAAAELLDGCGVKPGPACSRCSDDIPGGAPARHREDGFERFWSDRFQTRIA
jgi:hypothetical protein